MKLNLDDKEGDVGSKGRGTSNGAAGSSIKQRSTLLTQTNSLDLGCVLLGKPLKLVVVFGYGLFGL